MSLPDSANPFDSAPDPKSREAVKLGLFSYPVLQAADILLYGTTHVPVGEDQAQHLEFAREVANSFNHTFSYSNEAPVLIAPQTILSPAKRVMSLKEPAKKMSKSDPDLRSRILITDSKDEIYKKINGAKTDSIEGISYDRAQRPGVSNLIDILCYMDESIILSPEEVARDMQNVSMRALKEKTADSVEKNIGPIRERYNDIMSREGTLATIADEGAEKARNLAIPRLTEVKRAMGILDFPEEQ
jgi:tryptophanyl-tRNA synthetase